WQVFNEAEGSMIVCPNCKTKNSDNAQMCDQCGEALPRPGPARPTRQVHASDNSGAVQDSQNTTTNVEANTTTTVDNSHSGNTIFWNPSLPQVVIVAVVALVVFGVAWLAYEDRVKRMEAEATVTAQ
ncbi:MAG TPA: hypothetical protein PL105_23485, partial [Caldilineaceae bacterium]|nr:hypothetical protein [Caldilineaceae bacterium]